MDYNKIKKNVCDHQHERTSYGQNHYACEEDGFLPEFLKSMLNYS